MARFIELDEIVRSGFYNEREEKCKIFVNIDKITTVEEIKVGETPVMSVVSLAGRDYAEVAQSYSEVLAKIQSAQQADSVAKVINDEIRRTGKNPFTI